MGKHVYLVKQDAGFRSRIHSDGCRKRLKGKNFFRFVNDIIYSSTGTFVCVCSFILRLFLTRENIADRPRGVSVYFLTIP